MLTFETLDDLISSSNSAQRQRVEEHSKQSHGQRDTSIRRTLNPTQFVRAQSALHVKLGTQRGYDDDDDDDDDDAMMMMR